MGKKLKQPSNFQLMKEVLRICLSAPKKDKRSFLIVVALFGAASVFEATIPVLGAKLLNTLQNSLSTGTVGAILIIWTIWYVLVHQFSSWFTIAGEAFLDVVFCRYNTVFCQNRTKAFLQMPQLLLSSAFRQKAVSLIPRIGRTGENMVYNFVMFLFRCIHVFASAILLIGFLPLWAGIIFLLSACYGIFNVWINTKLKDTQEASLQAETNSHADREDTLENCANIRMLGIEDNALQQLQEKYEIFHQLNQNYHVKQIIFRLIPIIFNIISYLIIIAIGIHLAFQQKNIGTYIMLTGLGFDVLNYIVSAADRFKWLHLDSINYLGLCKQMDYNISLIPKSGKEKLGTIKEISLEKVYFTYPEEKYPVLNNLSLKIKAGLRVAIIGNSGMGKSTLINVMQHAYEIQGGKVAFNGKDVRSISRDSLRDSLTYIDQHPTFWNQKTIKENLLIFNPTATDTELYQALQSANLLDEIIRKEKGIDSKVTTLSAGQKQRLSLARALLRHTPIVIMDEPTANLDTHAQTKVLEGIKNLSKVKGQKPTVIFASNVPAEIASADRILLLEDGRIVEDGAPKKLMANPKTKVYNRLKRYKLLFE